MNEVLSGWEQRLPSWSTSSVVVTQAQFVRKNVEAPKALWGAALPYTWHTNRTFLVACNYNTAEILQLTQNTHIFFLVEYSVRSRS